MKLSKSILLDRMNGLKQRYVDFNKNNPFITLIVFLLMLNAAVLYFHSHSNARINDAVMKYQDSQKIRSQLDWPNMEKVNCWGKDDFYKCYYQDPNTLNCYITLEDRLGGAAMMAEIECRQVLNEVKQKSISP